MQRVTTQIRKRIPAFDRFIDDPSFRDVRCRRAFLKPIHGYEQLVALAQRLGPGIHGMCRTPTLTRQQEYHLFRRMNCLKYCSHLARRKKHPPAGNRPDVLAELRANVKECRDVLVLCNLRLVLSVLKLKRRERVDFEQTFSDGYVHLLQAIDRFDYRRGIKFSTYAIWTINNNFSRADKRTRRKVVFLPFTHLPNTLVEHDFDSHLDELERRSLLAELLSALDVRTRRIILRSEGVDCERRTYEDLSVAYKISRTSVYLIKAKGIKMLREKARRKQFFLSRGQCSADDCRGDE
jgi:RNA polymerase sigma factor (sigma-70 family)